MAIRAVVFDLGGTLIEYSGQYDSWPDLEIPGFAAAYESLSLASLAMPLADAFQAVGLAALPARWQRATEGGPNLALAAFLGEVAAECEIDASEVHLSQAAERYEQAICDRGEPLPGGAEMLGALRQAGFKLGLISNTMFRGEIHRRDLARFGLDEYFDYMLFSADAGVWKPQPEIFWHILEKLGVSPEEAVYVGDSPEHDIVGAKAAGMWVIHFPSTKRARKQVEVEPDATIQALSALPDALATLGA